MERRVGIESLCQGTSIAEDQNVVRDRGAVSEAQKLDQEPLQSTVFESTYDVENPEGLGPCSWEQPRTAKFPGATGALQDPRAGGARQNHCADHLPWSLPGISRKMR